MSVCVRGLGLGQFGVGCEGGCVSVKLELGEGGGGWGCVNL